MEDLFGRNLLKYAKKWLKPSLGDSKIEPGALQDAIFKRHLVSDSAKGATR